MRYGRVIFLLVISICIFETWRLWGLAPGQMAAHFNVQGNPDRFVPKAEFFWFQVQTLLIVIGVSFIPQIIFLVLPTSLINLPNRAYWLAPERKAETLDRISSFGAWIFSVILLAVQAAFELAVSANLQLPIRFNAELMLPVMLGSLAAIGLLLVWLTSSFRLPAPNK